MSLALKADITATDQSFEVVGDASLVGPGTRLRIDDEAIDVSGFEVWPVTGGGKRRPGTDPNHLKVNRGVGQSVAATHSAGATITAVVSALVSGTTLTTPDPFASGDEADPTTGYGDIVTYDADEFVSALDGGLETVNAVGATGTTETIALTAGNVQTFTVDGDCTFTMPSGLTSGKAISFTAILTDSGGPHALTFTGVKWSGGGNPTVTSGAGAVDIYTFLSIDGGTTWYGFAAGTGMAT